MKSTFPFLLAFLLAFVYHFDTLKVVSKLIGDCSMVCVDDFDGEEKDSETENSKTKNEKSDFSDDLFFDQQEIPNQLEFVNIHANQNQDFSTSDYSQVVFSPPEVA